MWIKFLLLSVIPMIAFYIAYIVAVGKLPTETVWFKNQNAYAEKWKQVREKSDRAGIELIIYATTKDKGALDRYNKARTEFAADAAELPALAGESASNNNIQDRSKTLVDELEKFKKEVADTPHVDATKLSAESQGWRDAARGLESAILMVIISELVTTPLMGIGFAGVISGVVWAILVLVFSLSCFMRYGAVKHNIKALASGQPLQPRSKLGCWDEISKLDAVVHEVAASKSAT